MSAAAERGDADSDRSNLSANDITRGILDISLRPVGHGGYSDIYTGLWWRADGEELKVAIKVIRASPIDPERDKIARSLRREISVWQRLSHPNIHILCGLCDEFGPFPALVSPWNENGDINNFLKGRSSDPDIDTVKLHLLFGVTRGLQFRPLSVSETCDMLTQYAVHDSRIVHGDVKGGNVLVSQDGEARLCDFGLSRLIVDQSESLTYTGVRGTFRWMAPELSLVEGARHTYATDMWACGCLFIEVWSAVRPYHTKANQQQVILALSQGEGPAHPDGIPDALWSVTQACCAFEPTHRPAPSQIISQYHFIIWLHDLITRGKPPDAAAAALFREIVKCIRQVGLEQASKLYALAGSDLAADIARRFSLWSLSFAGASRIYHHTVFQWCLDTSRRVRSVAAAQVVAINTLHTPEELRPFARLLDAVRPGLASELMNQFGTAMLGNPLTFDGQANTLAWFSDGDRIVVGFTDSTVRVVRLSTGETLLHLGGHTDCVEQVAISPDGRLIASCSHDGLIRLWEAETGLAHGRPMGGEWAVNSLAFSSDSMHVVSGTHHSLRIWSSETCRLVHERDWSSATAVACSPAHPRIVSGNAHGTIAVSVAQTGGIAWSVSTHRGFIKSIAYSPDGMYIAAGTDDRRIWVRSAASGYQVYRPLTGHTDPVQSVAFSPDCKHIASGSWDKTIRIWDALNGAEIATLQGHESGVMSVAFSPDGARLASASWDCSIRIWDATNEWMSWD